jgi:Ca2+-binding RTX toxin-like protein
VVPAGVTLQDGQLNIEGTVGSDAVFVNQSATQVTVRFNGLDSAFAASAVSRIRFVGLFGNDLFVNTTALPSTGLGGDGNDRLVGGSGLDTFDGGPGVDILNGRAGDDALNGGLGNDFVYGGVGNDVLVGSIGNDWLEGGSGDDLQRGNFGHDTLFGRDGNDDLSGDLGNDRLFGGVGDDMLSGGPGRDRIFGGAGNDIAFGGNGDVVFEVEEGQELIAALTGANGATGTAEFERDTGGGFPFDLEADGLAANTTFTVRVGGVLIGQFSTDAEGQGDLRLTSRTLPITSGTLIQVFNPSGVIVLQGTFAVGVGSA